MIKLTFNREEVPRELVEQVFSLPYEKAREVMGDLLESPHPLPEEISLENLALAFCRLQKNIIGSLFRAGFDPYRYDRIIAERYDLVSLFELLLGCGRLEMVERFLQLGYRPKRDQLDKLFDKEFWDNWSVVVLLVEEEIETDEVLLASLERTPVVAHMLYKRGYRIPKGKGGEMLSRAVKGGPLEILIEMGADPNERNEQGKTPLEVALDIARNRRKEGGEYAIVRAYERVITLLLLGADPRGVEWKEEDEKWIYSTLLVEASIKPVPGKLFEVLDAAGMLEGKSYEGYGFLHIAAVHGWVEDLRRAVKKLDPNARGKWKETPLHMAMRTFRSLEVNERVKRKIVRILLDEGANPNLENEHGKTPLYSAMLNGLYSLAVLLVARGAKPTPDWLKSFVSGASRRYGERRAKKIADRLLERSPSLKFALLASI